MTTRTLKNIGLLNAGIAILCVTSLPSMAENAPQSPPHVTGVTSPSGPKIVDDADPGWIWNGMVAFDGSDLFHARAHAGGPGSYAAYTFHGPGVTVVGMASDAITVDERVHKMGRAKISIDGKPVTTISVVSSSPVYDFNLCAISGLSNENHVLQVEADGGWVAVDYIKVATSSTIEPMGHQLEHGADAPPASAPVVTGAMSMISHPTSTPSTFSNERVWDDGKNTSFQFSFTRPYVNFRILVDSDVNTATGFQDCGIGADFLIENGTMYRSTVNGPSWDWQPIPGNNVNFTNTGGTITIVTPGTLNRAAIVIQGLDKGWHGDTDPNTIVYTRGRAKP